MYVPDERDYARLFSESICNVMAVPAQDKSQLRAHFQRQLDEQDFFSLIEKSSRLSEQFFNFTAQNSTSFKRGAIVSFYPFENEPQLNIEKETRDEPYQVAYVRLVNWKDAKMEACFARRDTPEQWEEYLLKNGTRIFQPHAQQKCCEEKEVSVVLVPGLAFTRSGKRLGRGAGFYDRYLARFPQALRLGIGFESQMTDSLPTDAWDQNLDLLLTDQAVYESKYFLEWKMQGKIGSRVL